MHRTRPARLLALMLVLGFLLSISGLFTSVAAISPASSSQRVTPEPTSDSGSDTAQDSRNLAFLPLTLNKASGSNPAQPTAEPTAEPTAAPTEEPTAEPTDPATPVVPPESEVREGHATFYGATGAGSCLFDPTPDDLMVGAMNHVDYDSALMCGAYVEVTGPEDVVVIRIVDVCPDDICVSGHIDLSAEAFDRIAEPSDGYIPITWRIVSPELDGPVVYNFKDGSSQYWTAVQVRNHRNPVATFEYLDSSGQFKSLERTDYNYFVEDAGMGVGPYTFRVTDIYGNVITDSEIEFVEDGDVAGQNQFPAP